MEKFDVTIIGSGPGGYVAAIRCAQLGFKTCSTLDVCSGVVCVCFPCARARVCEHVRAPVRADARVPCVRGGRTAYEVLVSCAGILDADNLLLATPSH